MPIHDWGLVNGGTFHHFHGYWVNAICSALNDGRLPGEYYAMVHARQKAEAAHQLRTQKSI